jgi:hypothetical protein
MADDAALRDDDSALVAALRDVVEERHWVLVRSERDVYTAELVGQGVIAPLTSGMVTAILAFEEGGTERS